jgi:hypothetical protein
LFREKRKKRRNREFGGRNRDKVWRKGDSLARTQSGKTRASVLGFLRIHHFDGNSPGYEYTVRLTFYEIIKKK